MTIYGENEFQFRPRPTALAIISASTSLLLLCAELANALAGGLYLLLARAAGLQSPNVWTAPFFATARLPFFNSPPLGSLFYLGTPIIFGASALIAFGLVHLWPTDQRLSVRMFMHSLALGVVFAGCLAPSFEKGAFKGLIEYAPVPPFVWTILFAMAGGWLAMHIERQSIVLFGNLFAVTTPSQRVSRWALRIPLAFVILAALSFLGAYPAGAYAAAIIVAATLLENISRRPREKFELVQHPEMREAAVTLPIVTAVIIAGAIFTFGFPALNGRSRTAVFSMKGVTLEDTSEVRQKHPLKVDLLRASDKGEGAPADQEIYIHWSKDRGKAKPQVGAPKSEEKKKK